MRILEIAASLKIGGAEKIARDILQNFYEYSTVNSVHIFSPFYKNIKTENQCL